MTWHHWDDPSFDWNQMYKAMTWMTTFFERATGVYPHTKEKYGSIRIEATWAWLDTPERILVWCEITKRAVLKFPKVGAELCIDLSCYLDYTNNGVINKYKSWFEGVCWGQCQSRWTIMGQKERWYNGK